MERSEMSMGRRKVWRLGVVLALAPALAATVWAQCQDVQIWAEQGEEGRFYSPNEQVVLQAGGTGMFRIYIRSRSESGYTTTAQIGHPWDFGLEGQKRQSVKSIVHWQPQNQQQVSLGTVRFQAGQPGQTALAYRILDVRRQGLGIVPQRCRTGYIYVQVVQRVRRAPQAPPPSGSRALNVAGTYSTEWGTLVLEQRGDEVRGSYSHQNGRIEGELQGNVLTGSWSQAPSYRSPNDAGSFQWTFSNDGRSFTGSWRYGFSGDWNGRWSGRR